MLARKAKEGTASAKQIGHSPIAHSAHRGIEPMRRDSLAVSKSGSDAGEVAAAAPASKSGNSQHDATGLGFSVPDAPCTDGNCPFHGRLRLHGRRLTGVVASARMRRTANIVIERMTFVKKYDRYDRRKSKLKVHNPECVSAKEGDKVDVVECRPISKTKHFVIVRKL